MAKGSVEIFIDLSKYGNELAAAMAQRVASEIGIKAKSLVRVKDRHLQNSIHSIGISRLHFIVVAETPYAAIQEWGPPDTPYWSGRKYTWRPYMTPAAEFASQDANLKKWSDESVAAAQLKAQARERKGL